MDYYILFDEPLVDTPEIPVGYTVVRLEEGEEAPEGATVFAESAMDAVIQNADTQLNEATDSGIEIQNGNDPDDSGTNPDNLAAVENTLDF